jgi:hypothetical protein
VALSGQASAVRYAYAPGEEHDGVTVRLDVDVVRSDRRPAEVEWSVPGLRPELAMELLRALPKALRRDLTPFPPKVDEIVRQLKPAGPSLLHDFATFLRREGTRWDVRPESWPAAAIPTHLRDARRGDRPRREGRRGRARDGDAEGAIQARHPPALRSTRGNGPMQRAGGRDSGSPAGASATCRSRGRSATWGGFRRGVAGPRPGGRWRLWCGSSGRRLLLAHPCRAGLHRLIELALQKDFRMDGEGPSRVVPPWPSLRALGAMGGTGRVQRRLDPKAGAAGRGLPSPPPRGL